jgi:hypothetical protein
VSGHKEKVLSAEGYSYLIVPNVEEPLLCPLFHLGSYNSVGGGLCRTHQQIKDGTADYVFPELYYMPSASVARKIGTVLKSGVSPNAPQELKDQVTGKSLQKGAVTKLTIHKGANIMDVCARSGHSRGINADKYNSRSDPSGSLIGGRILLGHQNITRPAQMAAPWWLGSNQRPVFDKLIDYLLSGCHVPSFLRGGKHFLFFCHLMAQQICHFGELQDEFGDHNGWVEGWIEIANRAKLYNP